MARDILHVMSVCVVRGVHTIAPVRAGDSSRRSGEIVKNLDMLLSIRLLSVVVLLVVVVVVVVVIFTCVNYMHFLSMNDAKVCQNIT